MILLKKHFFVVILLLITVNSFGQNIVSTYVGQAGVGFINGKADTAEVFNPFGMCIDKNNNLYIADAGNNCIRKINTTTGLVTTLAGNGTAGWKDGRADTAEFYSPSDLCVDDSGNVYVSDFSNQRIRKITITGMVITIAGNGLEGCVDGKADTAKFDYPRGICIDANRNLYIADSWNHRIRKITPAGMVSTYAGGGTKGLFTNGSFLDANDTSARFFTPSGLAIDKQGNVYVADAYNHRIRKISTTQMVTTFAGNGAIGSGNGGFKNGSKSVALLNTPTEVFADDKTGKLYFSDSFNNRVRAVDIASGDVTTLAGSGVADFNDAADTLAAFDLPRGIVADSSGDHLYVCDYNNSAIRFIALQKSNSVNELYADNGVVIFPNPSEGIFTLTGLKANIYKVEVYDMLGKNVKEINGASKAELKVNLSQYPKGIYLFNIRMDNGNNMISKVVIE